LALITRTILIVPTAPAVDPWHWLDAVVKRPPRRKRPGWPFRRRGGIGNGPGMPACREGYRSWESQPV